MDAVIRPHWHGDERFADLGPASLSAPAMPAEAPLEMPVQDLRRFDEKAPRPPSAPRLMWLRRAFVLGAAACVTAAAAYEMHLVLQVAGLTILELALLCLFVVAFAWIALAFTSALAGFLVLVWGGERRLGIDPRKPLPEPTARTAILMPTYNESPERVSAALQAMYEAIDGAGRLETFDFFILSDTTDPDIWIAEEAAFLALRERTGGRNRIFYRRRAKNTERKAGNIGNWCRRWGGRYEHMLVLDADSIMTADTIVRLSAAMEAHADVGLIQTLPFIVNRNTLFARLQQFAGRIYGPVIAHGIAWWHGSEGNFWGHNAIIRTRAFVERAGLPHLPGTPPFGGHILSHDFVEAALMRRGGWAMHMVPVLGGSYEESPPSLADLATRDRRWCQGNLQHMFVLPGRGLHWVSRSHFVIGIMSYVASPLWLIFLMTGMMAALQAKFIRPEYFQSEFSLFPQWPAQDPVRAAWLFGGTMGILLAPKLFGYIALLFRPKLLRASGGAIRAFLSLLIETVISGLLAPVMMIIQSVALGEIVTGRDAGWNPQRRDDGTIPLGDIARRHSGHTILGVALAAASYAVSPTLFLWMSPVIAGLLLSIPLASVTASRDAGLFMRRLGLLRIPEEFDPPAVLTRANEITEQLAKDGREAAVPEDAVQRLATDVQLMAAHRAMLPMPQPRRRGEIDVDLVAGLAKLGDAQTIEHVVLDLTRKEKAAVLADPRGVARIAEIAQREANGEEPVLRLA